MVSKLQVNKNLNSVPFVSVDHMMKIVNRIGIEAVLTGIAAYIKADFARQTDPLFGR